MIVVFDTNVWLSQLGMRSPAASSVRYFIKRNNYRVALPEVVKMEVVENFRSNLLEFIGEIKDLHTQLLTVFQKLPAVVLPADAEVNAIIPELFTSIGVEVIEVPFTMESATSSFLKTIKKIPPSNNTQQFKDGVLWADCMQLLDTDDVTLVTADKAFYAGHHYEKGLAKNLETETRERKHSFRILSSLADLLETIPKTVPFNEDSFVKAALLASDNNVTQFLALGYNLGQTFKVTRELFVTENPSKLFFEATVEIPCQDASAAGREEALLTLEANGLYSWESDVFDELNMETASFKSHDETGEETVRRGVWLRASATTSGHRQVTNIIREKIQLS
jgi:hypothetical protein